MPHLSRTVKIIGAFAAVAVLSSGIAVAASPALRSEKPTPPRAPQVAGASGPTQTGYVSLAPCRIVDTRKAGGPITGGFSRPFTVGGTTGFTGQGGSTATGCSVPVGASTVALAVTTTKSAKGNGYLTFYADGAARPTANQTSYAQGQNVTTLVNAPLNTSNGKVDVYALHTTHVIIDVAGYYREPIAGFVNADGTLGSHSAQIVSTSRSDKGSYTVYFDRSYSGCVLSVTGYTSQYNAAGQLGTNYMYVYTRDVTTTGSPYADSAFSFTVTC